MSGQAPATVSALLRAACARDPGHEALVDGERRTTYAELEDASVELAARLVGAGVGTGTRVGLLLPQGEAWVRTLLAITRIGAVAVPLSTLARPGELGRLVAHTGVEVLVVGDPPAPPEPLGASDLRLVLRCGPPAPPSAADRERVSRLEAAVRPEHDACVISTSGSTGAPKSVVHSQRGLASQSRALATLSGRRPDDRVLAAMPFFWVGGLVHTLLASLSVGATLLLQARFEPGPTLALMERERATLVIGWVTVARLLLADPRLAQTDLSSLRVPLGAQLDGARARSEGLGMTETLGPHTYLGLGTDVLEQDRNGSFGTPVPGFEHSIVDPHGHAERPPGAEGEIRVRGEALFTAIVGADTAGLLDDGGWYRTGDLGYFAPDGHLHFTGRLTVMIKTNGNNVSPAEVQAVLLRHPAVTLAHVYGRPDAERGERVCAVVAVTGAGADAGSGALREALLDLVRDQLASYKVPRDLRVVADDEVPLLPSGKPDLASLMAEVGDPAT